MNLRTPLFSLGFVMVAGACSYDSTNLDFGNGFPGSSNGGASGTSGSSGERPPPAPCETAEQCGGGVCLQGQCFPASASDGVQNGDETDVDCGGSAAPVCDDGKGCGVAEDCRSSVCQGGRCIAPSPTDGVKNGDETDVDCGGSAAPACADGRTCALATDCSSVVCTNQACQVPTSTDGVKNGNETDIDCGRAPTGADTGAPVCADGLGCLAASDCSSLVCTGEACQVPSFDDGVKNGTETDVDCGGPGAPANKRCAAGKVCVAHSDCSSDGCVLEGPAAGTCAKAPSCTRTHGATTCGLGENGEAGPLGTHEDCCTSLEVPGYAEAGRPGQRVFLDKYEVTAGRVREFLTRMTARSEALGTGVKPDVKSWLEAAPPQRWEPSWTQFLPSDDLGGVVNPLPNPGNGISGAAPVGVNYALSYAIYVYAHGDNCNRPANQAGGYSSPTYWMTPEALAGLNFAQAPRVISQPLLDQKSINCIPNALLAAFCAWDGGQLASAEVLAAVSGNGANLPARAASYGSSDGGQPTGYSFPGLNDAQNRLDGAARIAAPGRNANDVTSYAGAGPWHDLRGNVHEAALCSDTSINTTGGGIIASGQRFCGTAPINTTWFGLAFEGYGYSSARAGGSSHNGNIRYPEYKTAYAGGRCMRFTP